MRKLSLAFGLASCALLGACGGGGGSGSGTVSVSPGGNTPTPATPTPATPTPTPSGGGLNTGEIKPTVDATFIAATMEMTTTAGASSNLTGQTIGGATSNRSTLIDTPGFSASYTATTGYRLADALNAVSFGPAELSFDTTGSDQFHPTVLFTNIAAPVADYLALYKNFVTTSSILGFGTVAPRFAGNGGWQHSIMDTGSRRTRLNYFAFGPATPVSAMPRSGIVKYTLMGSGNYAGDTDLYFTSHGDTFTVDFGAGTISGRITGGGDNFFTGGFGGLYGVSLTGSIVGNAVTGQTESGVAVASGQFRLLFVGPNADEIIVTHIGQNGRGTYVGASVGVRNPYLP